MCSLPGHQGNRQNTVIDKTGLILRVNLKILKAVAPDVIDSQKPFEFQVAPKLFPHCT